MSYLGKVALKASDIRRLDVTSSTSATHTLTWTPPNEQSLIITINGVKQQNNYSISGVTLTLDSALVATDEMEVIGINDIGTTNVPGSGVITNDMLSSSFSVDTAELADDSVTADKLANSINTEIAANTAKVTNATHTGDVTGATALTIANDAVDIAMLSATGTADATTFLRGDNAWASAGGDNTPAFLALGVAQTLSHDTGATITMSNEVFDTDSAYNTGTYQFTVPSGEAGKYLVYGQVSFNAGASKLGLAASTVVKIPSGGSAIGQIYNNSSFKNNYGDAMTCTFTGVLDLGVADVVYISAIADTSDSSTISVVGDQGSDRYYTFWGMQKLIGV